MLGHARQLVRFVLVAVPVDAGGFPCQGEPEDRDGAEHRLAGAARGTDGYALLTVQQGQDLGLVVRESSRAVAVALVLAAGRSRPVDAGFRESCRIVQVFDDRLAGRFLPGGERLRVEGEQPADFRVYVQGLGCSRHGSITAGHMRIL